MVKHYVGLLVCFASVMMQAQDLKLFSLQDFDLNGAVKECEVVTDYGREIFSFDSIGRLEKVVTKYNQEDQDITSYRYKDAFLTEKRLESYKNGVLDPSTSMVNLYEVDSSEVMTVHERILSLDKEFYEEQRYFYDDQGRLARIITSHENAVDEMVIAYEAYKGETTKTYVLNGTILKSIRKSTRSRGGNTFTVTLTKDFVDGEPSLAVEERFDTEGKLISKETFGYDRKSQQFVSQEIERYAYDTDGFLAESENQVGNARSSKAFIFQFDDHSEKNWVKKITTPDNTYITRRITYYPEETTAEED
ncbi:hypothetical protein ABV409_07485 [Flagellimonas sp. DF-77]|uniref:hypothetical protein n=1 Tax=Flagellimonas algarum TaxID=3230298 RepID=UPI00339B43B1